MGNVHDRAAADAGDRAADQSEPHRRAGAEEAEAHDPRDADPGDRSSHLLPRAPAIESERHGFADAEAGYPSSSPRLRRVPIEEAEAHDRRDADASPHLLPRAPAEESEHHERADAGDLASSLRLRRAPVVDSKAEEAGYCQRESRTVGDTRQSVKPAPASDTGAQRGGRHKNGVGGDTNLLPYPAAEVGQHCGGRRENGAVWDYPHPNAQHSFGNPLSVLAHNNLVKTSNVGLELHYIDLDHVYELYVGGHLKRLLNYLDSFPGAVSDHHYPIIKELILISTRGEIPQHLKLEWNAKRAESARELAHR